MNKNYTDLSRKILEVMSSIPSLSEDMENTYVTLIPDVALYEMYEWRIFQ